MKQVLNISELMDRSGVKFGTSGARGLATAMTDSVCYSYTLGFLQYLQSTDAISQGDQVALAGDFRPSSPRIMAACAKAITDAGFIPLNCGFIPTPAVVLHAMSKNAASLMVTGSHIPDDRNGIKFNKPTGEILKHDEQGIAGQQVVISDGLFSDSGELIDAFVLPNVDSTAKQHYIKRYLQFFPEQALAGMCIGVYQHSTVARDVMVDVCEGLGAEVIALARSDKFIPVDTEAIRDEDVVLAKQWANEYPLDCIISADGDGDRPLVSDEKGEWLRGDVTGILCAKYLAADCVATPVSSNSALEKSKLFRHIARTQIGSPFVISAMDEMLTAGGERVVGYEANGGFLIASNITFQNQSLVALPTRDALIVPLAILMLCKKSESTVSQLLTCLPARYTYSDRLKNFPTELSQKRIGLMSSGEFSQDKLAIERALGDSFGHVLAIDYTDGLRITFDQQDVLHLRPSGNAPELRCYSESVTAEQAMAINRRCTELLGTWRDDVI